MRKGIWAALFLTYLSLLCSCNDYPSIREIHSEEVYQEALAYKQKNAELYEASQQLITEKRAVNPNTCVHTPRKNYQNGENQYFPVDGGHQYQCSKCKAYYGELLSHEYAPFETIKWTFVHDDARVTLVGSFCKQCGLCREYRMKTCMHEGYRWVVNPLTGVDKYQKMCSKCGMTVGSLYDALPEGAELYRYPSAETEAATGGES